jgi:putative ABC transport system permease protein
VKAYTKVLLRQFKVDYSRFISIILIVFLGIAFITGLSSTSLNMYDAMNTEYETKRTSDYQIMTTTRFTNDQITSIEQNVNIDNVVKGSMIDYAIADNLKYRIYVLDFEDLNIPHLNQGEILSDTHFRHYPTQFSLFDTFLLTVVDQYSNPLYNIHDGLEEHKQAGVSQVFYMDSTTIFEDLKLPTNYLKVYLKNNTTRFNKPYEKLSNQVKKELSDIDSSFIVMSLFDNESFMTFKKSSDSIGVISGVLPVIFFVVILTVILSAMSKMIDKERNNIGIMKTLGINNTKIINKYILYVSIPTLIGGIAGTLFGFRLFPMLIWSAYEGMFDLPILTYGFYYLIPVACFAGLVGITIVSTLLTVNSLIKEQPSSLLRAKSPKPGKAIILEKFPFIWKRLSFKYKSMFKNIFRYTKNTFLTILGISASSAIMTLAIGLKKSIDIMFNKKNWFYFTLSGSPGIIYLIVLILIIFSILLGVVIIFSLVNIMIDERKQEISTLRILGYTKREVVGYLYREEAILVVLGLILGLVLGYLLLNLIIELMISNGTPLTLSSDPLIFVISTLFISIFTIISFGSMVAKINKISLTSIKAIE